MTRRKKLGFVLITPAAVVLVILAGVALFGFVQMAWQLIKAVWDNPKTWIAVGVSFGIGLAYLGAWILEDEDAREWKKSVEWKESIERMDARHELNRAGPT